MLQQQTKKKQKQNMVVFRDYRKQAVKLVNSQKEKKSNKSNKTISTNMYLTTCVPMAISEMTLYPKVQTVKETFYVLSS